MYKVPAKLTNEWPSIKRVITIRRIRKTKENESDCIHYYISSLTSNSSKLFLDIIRKHWWVENKLHHVKDVVLNEDNTKFRTFDRYKKNAVFRNIAFNFLKLLGFKSIKYGMEKCANNVSYSAKLASI